MKYNFILPMIEFKNTTICFEQNPILENFSWFIPRGAKAGIIGPSGKGKSSLLNAIAGFIPIKEGTVLVDGKTVDATSVLAIREQLSYLPQDLSLDFQTARELLLFPFTFNNNRHKQPSESTIITSLERLGLNSSLLSQDLNTISGGQRQKIVLLSVLLLQKKIILLDEPTSALDDLSVEQLASWICSLEEATVLSVSHDNRWIEKMDICQTL